MASILIIDDDIDICSLLERFLTRKGYHTEYCTTSKKAMDVLQKKEFDLILCDFRLPDGNGKDLLQKIKSIKPDAKVVMITAYSDVKTAVDIIKAGAIDYITKPLLPDEILALINRVLSGEDTPVESGTTGSQSQGPESAARRKAPTDGPKFIVGRSKEAQELQKQIELVAPTNYSVIIYGESGTGKESVAQSIHLNSQRANKPFVAVDCGALTRELAASELFGHEKGAFTGAMQAKPGQFELANGGTIFLDEIANLSYEIQVSLLRMIQERKVKRLGSSKDTEVDVRIIVASNERLSEACASGRFREDLYYRFNEFSINLPALRERKNDIMQFADFFLRKTNEELDKGIEGFSEDVEKIFVDYRWPGNLREMNNVIKRAVLLTGGGLIRPEALPQEVVFDIKFNQLNDGLAGPRPANGDRPGNLKTAAQNAEYEMILDILKKFKFNKSKAAQYLNIDRKTLYNKMKSFNMLED